MNKVKELFKKTIDALNKGEYYNAYEFLLKAANLNGFPSSATSLIGKLKALSYEALKYRNTTNNSVNDKKQEIAKQLSQIKFEEQKIPSGNNLCT